MPYARLVARPSQLVHREHARQVDEGARDRCHWDPAPRDCFAGMKHLVAPSRQTFDAPFGRGDYVRRRLRTPEEAEQVSGGPSAEERALPASEDRGEVAGLQ